MRYGNLYSKIKIKLSNHILYIILIILLFSPKLANASGWMTYRHDTARSGVTAEQVVLPLSLHWTFKPNHVPKPTGLCQQKSD